MSEPNATEDPPAPAGRRAANGAPRGASAALPEPEPADLQRSGALCARIRDEIARSGGWISFARYMAMALYEPGLGYYDGRGSKFGAQGDFVTAPEISPLFAQSLAAPVGEAFAQLPARILEFGAGTGALAFDLLHALRERGTPAAQYFIVEVSADLRARQQQRLAGLPVTWLDHLPESFEGVVIANEVLDVLPVHLFVRTGPGAVQERGVALVDGVLAFQGREAAPELAAAVAQIESVVGTLPVAYGSEVCPLAQAWIRSLGHCLRRGLVLLFDYGFPRHEYYHPQRAMGTLMCHYRQHAHADPLWLPGLNDITAHVDFSACAQAAAEAGLEVLAYTSQAHFLMNSGILQLLAPRLDAATTGAVQRLVSEAEMGELVKVMALGRDVALPASGFSRGDRRHRL